MHLLSVIDMGYADVGYHHEPSIGGGKVPIPTPTIDELSAKAGSVQFRYHHYTTCLSAICIRVCAFMHVCINIRVCV